MRAISATLGARGIPLTSNQIQRLGDASTVTLPAPCDEVMEVIEILCEFYMII